MTERKSDETFRPVVEEARAILRGSGLSLREIARGAGLAGHKGVHRFLAGHGGLGQADTFLRAVGLRVQVKIVKERS